MNVRPTRHSPTARAWPAPWGPGHGGVLLVLAGPAAEVAPWGRLVTTLADALGLGVAVEATPGDLPGPGWVDTVVRRAAGADGPVLVLPALAAGGEATELPDRALTRVLAPFDATDEVSETIVPVLQRLQEADVQVDQLHVTNATSVPAMWEGSGHHAIAWHAEMRRRHQAGSATVEVVGGAPAVAVAARAGKTDVVLLCWARSTGGGRAQTVRAVLRATTVPVMLLARYQGRRRPATMQ